MIYFQLMLLDLMAPSKAARWVRRREMVLVAILGTVAHPEVLGVLGAVVLEGPGGPGGPQRGGGPPMSSSNTWLRGGFPTDASGTVELTTIYPGFYQGRTIHVHLMVRTGWDKSENGTLVSHSGSLKHVGQMFFKESWNDKVLANPPYSENKARRTLNKQDHDFSRATIDGSSAIVQ